MIYRPLYGLFSRKTSSRETHPRENIQAFWAPFSDCPESSGAFGATADFVFQMPTSEYRSSFNERTADYALIDARERSHDKCVDEILLSVRLSIFKVSSPAAQRLLVRRAW